MAANAIIEKGKSRMIINLFNEAVNTNFNIRPKFAKFSNIFALLNFDVAILRFRRVS
jgi:hypothetical protein